MEFRMLIEELHSHLSNENILSKNIKVKIKKFSKKEAYLKTIYDMYVDPTWEEINSMSHLEIRSIRMIVDIKKNIVYAASSSLLHASMCDKLGINYEEHRRKSNDYVFCYGIIRDKKLDVSLTLFNLKKLKNKKFLNKFKYIKLGV